MTYGALKHMGNWGEISLGPLGILAHRTSDDEQGVYNHLNETQGI